MDEPKRVPQIGRYGVCTNSIIQYLLETPLNEVTDAQLEAVCHRPTGVGQAGYSNLQTALQHIETEHGIIWQRISGKRHIRRLDKGTESEAVVHAGRKSIARKTRRTTRQAMCVDIDKLPEDRRADFLATKSQLAVLALCASSNTTKALAATGTTLTTDPKRLLAAMVNGKPQPTNGE